MSSLPAVDLGLMTEHLLAHDGVITKLAYYQNLAASAELRSILQLQEKIMQSHVWVMMAFINPSYHYHGEVPPLSSFSAEPFFQGTGTEDNNKWIALEAHNTAKNMSLTNYQSAMMMQDKHVRKAHIEMALQQNHIKALYADYISKMGWNFTPMATPEAQMKTLLHFQYLLR
ncbi:hypothetical protein F9U64_14455 [Gracilibacillus oryzae]|uniref:Spore coat protein n=1 Tax=Gracilibacillus oryzae TaxID=1672701 RepID=A0A7C8KP79_9BACI|nr:hypothetical protein [Gracilibacillus oryzae]KAB8130109.1 hypothetical protein F9U64_14455 [Gracilibacillus oryzae]